MAPEDLFLGPIHGVPWGFASAHFYRVPFSFISTLNNNNNNYNARTLIWGCAVKYIVKYSVKYIVLS